MDETKTVLRHHHRGGPKDVFPDAETPHHRLEGRWTYCAPAYPHFGHMMAEFVHRILPSVLEFGPKRFLMLGGFNGAVYAGFDTLPDYWRQVFDFFGVDRDTLVIAHLDVSVDFLQIVEQGASYGIPPKPWYLTMLRNFARRRLAELRPTIVDCDNVYVSRSRIEPSGGMLGERYIEAVLQKAGFFIFHPQEGYSLVEQAAQYTRAKRLIFAEGSACHGAEILGSGMLGHVGVILRRLSHAALFEEVLSTRSMTYCAFDDITIAGTLAVHPLDGSLQDNHGVSILNLASFEDFLIDNFEIDVAFDAALYKAAVDADLRAYIDHYADARAEDVARLREMTAGAVLAV